MRSETYNALSTTFWLDTTPHAADLTLPCAGSAGTTNITNVSTSTSSSILTSFPFPFHFTLSLPPKLAILTFVLFANLCCGSPFTLPFCFPLVSTGSTSISIPAPTSLAFHPLHADAGLPIGALLSSPWNHLYLGFNSLQSIMGTSNVASSNQGQSEWGDIM